MPIYSKLSAKAQTVIPKEIRNRLGLRPGDMIHYKITGDSVELERASGLADDPFATFTERGSDADDGLRRTLMITSRDNRGWPGDVEIGQRASTGLPAPPIVRPVKIATVDTQ